jgi:hypothetical protein
VIVFGLDPGPVTTGWALLDTANGRVLDAGAAAPNHDALRWVIAGQGADLLAIEMFSSLGMVVGQSSFDTVRWVGRFQQAWHDPEDVALVLRRDVKMHLCDSMRAKDSNVRQALIDALGPQGTKRNPGPTYGVASHAWSALAVCVTAVAQRDKRIERPGIRLIESNAG